ncbi:hypothetical protein HY212_01395 [Candidatus Pacearchaeota archaeon]|nr:hypothetical protein [Candidatus Pacearchaeota archaeon]
MDQEMQETSTGQKILSTGYKVEGWGLRVKAVINFILGGILFVLGIVMAISVGFPFLIVSLLGVGLIIGGWIYWRRSKSLAQGRFY